MARKRRLLVPEAREAINGLMRDVILQRESEPNQKRALPLQRFSPGQSPASAKGSPLQETHLSGPSTAASKPVSSPAPAGSMVDKLIRLAKQEQQKNDPSMRK